MTTWTTQQLAAQHRTDLLAAAARHGAGRKVSSGPPRTARPTVDARLGWFLIRVGSRLVALRPEPVDSLATANRPGC